MTFVAAMAARPDTAPPPWLATARALAAAQVPTIAIALRLDLNPAWLAHAYRLAAGEGLHDTARRRRVEQAVALLRTTDEPIAEIAAAAGFCDQSHLNRAVASILGRTPRQVRRERDLLPVA